MDEKQKEQEQIFKTFRKRRRIFRISMIGLLFVIPITVYIQYRITESMLLGTVTLGIFMAVLFAVITAGIASGASRCPYCGAILIRQYSETCNACGKKLR